MEAWQVYALVTVVGETILIVLCLCVYVYLGIRMCAARARGDITEEGVEEEYMIV